MNQPGGVIEVTFQPPYTVHSYCSIEVSDIQNVLNKPKSRLKYLENLLFINGNFLHEVNPVKSKYLENPSFKLEFSSSI